MLSTRKYSGSNKYGVASLWMLLRPYISRPPTRPVFRLACPPYQMVRRWKAAVTLRQSKLWALVEYSIVENNPRNGA